MAERSDRPEGCAAAAAPLLSVVIPVYNEENLISEVLRRVRAVPIRKQIIVVDDGSTDGTVGVIERLRDDPAGDVLIVHQAMINMGKGTAIRIGLRYAVGDIVLIQDADMEYDPDDYPALACADPARRGGCRLRGAVSPPDQGDAPTPSDRQLGLRHRRLRALRSPHPRRGDCLQAIHYSPGLVLVFRREVIMSLDLHASRFEFCPEVTAKICKRGYRLAQVPISYTPRTFRRREEDRLARRGPHALDARPLPLLRLTELCWDYPQSGHRSVAYPPRRDVYSEPSPDIAGNKEWATWQQRPLT